MTMARSHPRLLSAVAAAISAAAVVVATLAPAAAAPAASTLLVALDAGGQGESPVAAAAAVAAAVAAAAAAAPASPAAVAPAGRAAVAPPVPVTAKHFAHAVIDPHPPTVIDLEGDGEQSVTLSAYDSHTHRFKADGTAGSLVSYTWTNGATGAVLGRGSVLTAPFPLGATLIRLVVVDDGQSESADESVVTVVGSLSSGAYCYYYKGDAGGGAKPVFAAVSSSLAFPSAAAFPAGPHGQTGFSQRCVFLFNASVAGEYAFEAAFAGGDVTLAMDGTAVVAAPSTRSSVAVWRLSLAAGMHEAVTLYRHVAGGAAPAIVITAAAGAPLPAGSFSWDRATVVPIITGIAPATGGLSSGTRVTLKGLGFFGVKPRVTFGGRRATRVVVSGPTQLIVTAPEAPAGPGAVSVVVTTTGRGLGERSVSGAASYTYQKEQGDPIKFTQGVLKGADGGDYELPGPTSLALGPDGRVYVGHYAGFIRALTITADYTVTDACVSQSVGANRSVLSVSFDPLADGDGVSLLATTGRLYYYSNLGRPLSEWDNGEVVVLRPGVGGHCLGVERVLLSGLPVSNHDHAVQALEWDQTGRLLLNTGGQTNQGANVNAELMGGDETPLSAAVLVAPVHSPDFDGRVTYDQTTDARASRQTGGFGVSVYAAGLRNSFDTVLHTNGELYATDNGPNQLYGSMSVDCATEAPGFTERDRLLRLSAGGYYGHANRNRARDDARQCIYHGLADSSGGGYTAPLSSLGLSSINGIMEYTANLFGGALKHDLLLTKFSGSGPRQGLTLRVQLSPSGLDTRTVSELFPFSGLTMAQTASGAVLSPQVQKNRIIVFVPDVLPPDAAGGPVVVGVGPHRGRAGGGTALTVAGHHFGDAPTATVGGRPCTAVRAVAADGRSFVCTAPAAATPGALVRVVVTTAAGRVSAVTPGRGDYWYMEV